MNKTISDEKIIAALLACDTKTDAVRLLKIRRNTLSDRMRSPEFQRKYTEAKAELITAVVNKVEKSMLEAVEIVAEIMHDTENAPQIRLNAADSIIRHGIKLIEARDILERLDALETAYQNLNI